MTTPLPMGVIGVGALGRHHARHLAALPSARLVGVYDIDHARAAMIAAEVGSRAYTDPDRLLADVEAVSIAVPTSSHAAVGLRALNAGLPVLIEKPLAATLTEADALMGAAARGGLQLQVGHIERFNRAVRAATPWLDEPRFLESQRLAPFQTRGTDVAVVLDLMIHDLDLILELTGGEVTDVRASGVAVLSPHLDVANAWVEFACGAVASATASRVARERRRQLRLFQRNGHLALDLATGTAEFIRLRDGWEPGFDGPEPAAVQRVTLEAAPGDALALELESFVSCVRENRDPIVTGAHGRAALALALRVTAAVAHQPVATLPD